MKITDDLVTLELDLDEQAEFVANLFIQDGMLRERERIIELLMTRYEDGCCCDSAAFGDHYLSHKQPDNLIDMIKKLD